MNQEDKKHELILFFFSLRNTLYLYHLSTYSYPRHKAVADLLDTFDDLIDKFLEIYFGKYGRPDQFPDSKLDLFKLTDANAYMQLSSYIEFLRIRIPDLINPKDSDLFNIRDEMMGVLNNSKYLFELK
jgi:hypothetical protein